MTPIRLCVTLLLALTSPLTVAASIVELDRIIAIVDDDVITARQLDSRLQQQLRQLRGRDLTLPPVDILRRQLLDRMVLERLQLNLATTLGVVVDDETVQQVVLRIAKDNDLPLDRFRLALQQDGIDYAAFREQVRDEMVIARLRQRQVENRIELQPQEVNAALARVLQQPDQRAEYRIVHLLVALPSNPSPSQIQTAKERATALLQQLREGVDFQQLVLRHSDGPNALEGGDLGWRSGDRLPTLFAPVVARMGVGEHSDLIRSPSGFHIIQLAAKRGESAQLVEQTRARHILMRTDAVTSDAQVQERLQQLRQRIIAGESFAALAQAHSQDPGSAAAGGELDWATAADYVPPFSAALAALSPGELSEPVQTPFGWHLIEVLERRQHDNSVAQQRARIREALQEQKLEEALQNWLRQLRDEAYVELRLEG